ncbi:MAG: ribose 5-phosphate isomerase B [Clostridia bacterium]|nr:ribose 5-phosphate isomerase B [Clostridia bacterium]
MKIAIASDHRGFKVKNEINRYLEEQNIEYEDFGTYTEERMDYPEVAVKVAEAVQKKECDLGILICGTGFGMSLVANKYKGIRCTPCYSEEAAKFARAHNDANILALGAEHLTPHDAIRILRVFLATEFEGGRHSERLKMIEEVENKNMK